MRPIVRYAQLYAMLNCPRPEVTNPIVPRSKMCAPFYPMVSISSKPTIFCLNEKRSDFNCKTII